MGKKIRNATELNSILEFLYLQRPRMSRLYMGSFIIWQFPHQQAKLHVYRLSTEQCQPRAAFLPIPPVSQCQRAWRESCRLYPWRPRLGWRGSDKAWHRRRPDLTEQ